ncbi:MAG: hypothetical protein JWR71_3425 [Pseudarthrobacter sp.]|nr:hypothetical protein [Pseudarthrobacter sp.]
MYHFVECRLLWGAQAKSGLGYMAPAMATLIRE